MDPFLAPPAPDFSSQEFSYQGELTNPATQIDQKRQEGGNGHQQMVELCSPIISSTSHPELKATNGNMVHLRSNYQASSRHQDNNIGSLITMLIDDQGADLDDILTESRERNSEGRDSRLDGLQNEIKEENCLGDGLTSLDYPRPFPSPDYAYYQRDYVAQEIHEKDIESRSSLSSNSEGDDDLSRYPRPGSTFDPILSHGGQNNPSLGPPTPYMLTRDTGQHTESGCRKDEKYWERRRKNNLAAKKSRDARRVRENQLRLRVLCLENANRVLREQMDRKEQELVQIRERLSKYETPPQTQNTAQAHPMTTI